MSDFHHEDDSPSESGPGFSGREFNITTPFLDECGSVYIPAAGAEGDCVRLNQLATQVWRQIVVNGVIDPTLSQRVGVDEVLETLRGRGALDLGGSREGGICQ